ncbi:MAG TPA: hypothetical protein DDX54_05340 [Rhodospirillaceae bacterium]|jgi:hypothetical protein|nr:hypothetical protein [Alphaproteobacteria bacterium]HBH26806.1 hypothetical protein [Rhodospirillaceae bacterium]
MRVVLIALALLASAPAFAESKQVPYWWGWWGAEHWGADLFAPYADPPMVTHGQRWADDPFTPQDWVRAYPSREAFVSALQAADIVTGLRERDGVPTFITGASYADLSPRDRARLAQTLGALYGNTAPGGPGAFRIVDGTSGRTLGLYTKAGFQTH